MGGEGIAAWPNKGPLARSPWPKGPCSQLDARVRPRAHPEAHPRAHRAALRDRTESPRRLAAKEGTRQRSGACPLAVAADVNHAFGPLAGGGSDDRVR